MDKRKESVDYLSASVPVEALPSLTSKQKLFVKEKIDNPKISNTEAAMRSYELSNRQVGGQVGYENMKKPEILMALGQHSEMFESVIVGVAKDWGKSENTRRREIALDAAKFGHDKVHGKATVKVMSRTEVVKIAINLTGDNEAPPADMIDMTDVEALEGPLKEKDED